MTRFERGDTLTSAIRKIGDARLYGEEKFITGRDITERAGTKRFGDLERRVQRQRRGQPLGTVGGIEMFRTKYADRADYDDGLGDDDDFNVPLRVNRQIAELAPQFEAIKPNTLVILYKNNEGNLNTCRLPGDAYISQCNALSIVPISVYNYAIGLVQHREARADPARYRKRTPVDYFLKDYTIDGIPDTVQPMQNRASVFCAGSSMIDGAAVATTPYCTSLATMFARGMIESENYWGSAIKPGATIGIVIKKFEPSDYCYDYMIEEKMLTNHAAKKLALAAENDCSINLLRPYQAAFFVLPDGGPVPNHITRYYDEEGNLRYDGHVIIIGTITEIPLGHTYREPSTRLKPFTGAIPLCALSQYTVHNNDYGAVNHHPIKIKLKPDDGVMPV